MEENGVEREKQALLSSSSRAYSEDDLQLEGDKEDETKNVSSHPAKPASGKISGKAWGVLQFRKLRQFPFSVLFIVGNEFCERFSYYGMRAVLVLFLTSQLNFGDDSATAYYHAFIMLCYFLPLVGAVISDSCLGKYGTILSLSVVYALGNVIVSVAAVPITSGVNIALTMVGLVVIALGTGGIKPCVSAFGGDQFKEDQQDLLRRFFSIFYFSINAGSVLSTLLTPVLRSQVQCVGTDQCFPLAFGVPAVLMIVSIFVFVAGTRYYIIKKPSKQQASLFLDVPASIAVAIHRRITLGKLPEKKNFMQYATPKYSEMFVEDVWLLLRVLVMMLPLPVFWALFDQQGSRWTLQAVRMNGRLGEDIEIQPDQVQALNPILILVFIPLFETIVYPIFAKCRLLERPLQRMVVGMLLAGVAFVVAGVVQLEVQASDHYLKSGEAKAVIINGLPETLNLRIGSETFDQSFGEKYEYIPPKLGEYVLYATLTNESANFSFQLQEDYIYPIVVSTFSNGSITFAHSKFKEEVPEGGEASVQVINAYGQGALNFTLCERKSCSKSEIYLEQLGSFNASDISDVDTGRYYYRVESGDSNQTEPQISRLDKRLSAGGIYALVITEGSNDTFRVTVTVIDEPNDVSIFLQVPMYVIITAGEVMFSISGLEFAYSQAPASMKALCQAAWLWTVAFGNLFVVIVAEARIFSNQAVEFFFFAACIVGVAILFAVMAFFYKYVDLSKRLQASDLSGDSQDESRALVFSKESPGGTRRTDYTGENVNAERIFRDEEEDTNPSESEL